VLFRQKAEPQGLQVVEQISSVYTATYGQWSQIVFFAGAFCTLFSTLVVYTAASGRMWTDLAISLGFLDRDNSTNTHRCHQTVQFVWLAALMAAFLLMEKQPARLIVLGHFVLGAFMTPLLMFAICWMAFHTDRRVRMGRWWATALLASAAIILYCVLRGLYLQYLHTG
jgi:amino acid transporter